MDDSLWVLFGLGFAYVAVDLWDKWVRLKWQQQREEAITELIERYVGSVSKEGLREPITEEKSRKTNKKGISSNNSSEMNTSMFR